MEDLHFAIFEKLFSRQMFEFKESSFLSRQSCCRNAASVADWSIVVIQQGHLPRVKNTIENAGGRILGVVLNKVDVKGDQNYRYSTNYIHYST
jgi:hypothetical protein